MFNFEMENPMKFENDELNLLNLTIAVLINSIIDEHQNY